MMKTQTCRDGVKHKEQVREGGSMVASMGNSIVGAGYNIQNLRCLPCPFTANSGSIPCTAKVPRISLGVIPESGNRGLGSSHSKLDKDHVIVWVSTIEEN